MTIPRANPVGFGVGDKLTSAQINAIDINTTSGLDRRAAQTDTLASTVTLTGHLVCAIGSDINFLSGAVMQLSAGSVCMIATGGNCSVGSGGQLTVMNGGTLTAAAGSVVNLQGTVNAKGGPVGFFVAANTVAKTSLFTTSSLMVVDVTELTITFAGAKAGDILVVDGMFYGLVDASDALIRHRVLTGGGVNWADTVPGSSTVLLQSDDDAATHVVAGVNFSFVVDLDGSLTVKTRLASSAGGAVGLHGAGEARSSLRAMLFRMP